MNMDIITSIIVSVFLIAIVLLYFWTPKWLQKLGSAAAWAIRN